jgi:hypothetical protein
MSEKNSVPVRPRRRLLVTLAAAVVLIAVAAAALVLPGWRARQIAQVEEELQPLSPQEIAEVKAAVEKQTGMPIRYVSGIRQGVVDAFPDGIPGRPAYRVKKTDKGWKVIEEFHAFFA